MYPYCVQAKYSSIVLLFLPPNIFCFGRFINFFPFQWWNRFYKFTFFRNIERRNWTEWLSRKICVYDCSRPNYSHVIFKEVNFSRVMSPQGLLIFARSSVGSITVIFNIFSFKMYDIFFLWEVGPIQVIVCQFFLSK